jgi:hypothetical protein
VKEFIKDLEHFKFKREKEKKTARKTVGIWKAKKVGVGSQCMQI